VQEAKVLSRQRRDQEDVSMKKTLMDLEVEEIENRTKPGCNSSSTSPLCTCPISVTTTD
jgi:hypothetical protein